VGIAFQCTCGAEIAVQSPGQKEASCRKCLRIWRRSGWGDAFEPAGEATARFLDGGDQAIPLADNACGGCGDTGLLLGGWMGPTKDAPYPRACHCERGRELDTPRKVQLKVAEIVDRNVEEGGGYWTAKYPALATLAGHLEDVERAVETDAPLPPVFNLTGPRPIPVKSSYVDSLGLDVLELRMDRYGRDLNLPEFRGSIQEVQQADVVKLVDERTGRKRVVKHRASQAPYFECGDDREPFGTCTKRRGHEGAHQDDVKGRGWDP
jgi:hypothetical protein